MGVVPAENQPAADYKPEEDDENYESGVNAPEENKDGAERED